MPVLQYVHKVVLVIPRKYDVKGGQRWDSDSDGTHVSDATIDMSHVCYFSRSCRTSICLIMPLLLPLLLLLLLSTQ